MTIIKIKKTLGNLKTEHKPLLNAMIERYSFSLPGAFYSPAYKKGFWDGKKKFIDKHGNFPAGLKDLIIKDLNLVNCEFSVEEDHTSYPTHDKQLNGIEYRDYQAKIVDRAINQKRAIIKAPTGSGKTVMMAGIIQSFRSLNILCLFNSKHLVKQSYEFILKHISTDIPGDETHKVKVGINSGDGFIYGNIMFSTSKSVHKLLGTPMENPDIIIFDEVHEFCKGKFNSELLNSFDSASYRFGFTATLPKEKIYQYTLIGGLGSVIEEKTTQELIQDGAIAKPLIQFVSITPKEEDLKVNTYSEYYEKYIIKNTFRNNYIETLVEDIKKSNKNPKIMIIVKNLEHGEILSKLIKDSKYLEGKDATDTREKTISKFRKSKKAECLIGTTILQTGIDIPEISHYINARGLESKIATIQALGRSTRIHKSTPEVKVYDFIDRVRYLEDHSMGRIRAYKSEGHDVLILKDEIIYDYT